MNTLTQRTPQDLNAIIKASIKGKKVEGEPVKAELPGDRKFKRAFIQAAKKATRKPEYLDNETLKNGMMQIHERLFAERATELERQACKEIAKGFTYVIPYSDRYIMFMESIKITEGDLRRFHKGWDTLPETHKNQFRKAAKRHDEQVQKALDQLSEFVNRQAYHLGELDDATAEMVMDLEPSELDKVKEEIGHYLKPTTAASHFMTAKEISRYLITQSKGLIYYDAIEVSKELRKLNYPQGTQVRAGKKVKGYYVKVVN